MQTWLIFYLDSLFSLPDQMLEKLDENPNYQRLSMCSLTQSCIRNPIYYRQFIYYMLLYDNNTVSYCDFLFPFVLA